jgi:hypothetical protein
VKASNYLKQLPPAELDSAVKGLFSRVFGTPDGALALAVILDDLYWNKQTETPGQMELRNYATVLVNDRIGLVKGNLATLVALFNTKGE